MTGRRTGRLAGLARRFPECNRLRPVARTPSIVFVDPDGTQCRSIVGMAVAIGVVLAAASAGAVVILPGGGPPRSDCFVVLSASGEGAFTAPATVGCTDGDPSCDGDGACNDTCTITVALCVNQPAVGTCTPPTSLARLTVTGGLPVPGLEGASCGAAADEVVAVRLRRGVKKPGRRKIVAVATTPVGTRPRVDRDVYRILCHPRLDACPTTTTSSSTTTSTTLPICGDGVQVVPEECDDANTINSDGCSAICTLEHGFNCLGQPSVCATVCGDGLVGGIEGCDDANTNAADGCSPVCTQEPGFSCSGEPSVCSPS